jgi:hypothetical protein
MPTDFPGSKPIQRFPVSHEVPKPGEEEKPSKSEVHVSPAPGLVAHGVQVGDALQPRANALTVSAADVREKFLDLQPGKPAELEGMLATFVASVGAGREPAQWSAGDFDALAKVIKDVTAPPRPLANDSVRACGKIFASHVISLVSKYGETHPAEAVGPMLRAMQSLVISGVLQEFHDGVTTPDLAQRFFDVIATAKSDSRNGRDDLRMLAWLLQRPIKNKGAAPAFAAQLFENGLIAACRDAQLDAEVKNMEAYCAKLRAAHSSNVA